MFKVPEIESISVLGQRIPIIINSEQCDQLGADGFFHTGNESIVLRSEYSSEHRFFTVLSHEILHAHFNALGTQFDHTLEEILANTISVNLTDLFFALLDDTNEPPEIPEE